MQIRRINQNLFAVESESQDKSYTVNLANLGGQGSCSCPHHQFRGAACKHLVAVQAYVANLAAPSSSYARAAERAQALDDAALWQSLERYPAGPVAGAIRMELARRANEQVQPEPRAIPAGVMELLAGATPAEVERALAVYGR